MAGLTITVGAVDITAYVDVTSIFVEEVGGAIVATCGFTVKDHTGTVSISTKDTIDIDDDGTTIFAGEVASVTKKSQGITKVFTVRGQDYNILLEETVVASESYAAGVSDSYILGNATYGLFPQYRSDIDASTYVSTLDASMEAVAFAGMTLREILDDLARRTGGRYYVDYDKNLHWFSTESNDASFSLSTSPNMSSSFPFGGFAKTEEVTRLAEAVYVLGKEVADWHPDEPPYDGSERHAVSRDQRITTAQGITDRGTAIIDRYGAARETYELWTEKDGLRAGQSVTVVNETWDVNSAFYIRRLRMEMIGRDGEKRRYFLELNDEAPDSAKRAKDDSLTVATIETQVNSIGDTVFDTDAPATPTFNSGNVTTGIEEDADGHQMAWLQITWGAVSESDVDHYEVQVSTSSDFSGHTNTRNHPSDGDRIERFEGLLGNTTYYIRVRAVDWCRNASSWSGTESKLTDADTDPPEDVTGFTALATPIAVHLTWDANSEADLRHYEIQRKPDGGAYSTLALFNGTFFIDNTASIGTDYWYQIRAEDTSGNTSDWAEIGSAVGPDAISGGEADLSLQGWSHNLTFSATDHNTIAWSSGTITLGDGSTSYSIDAGNTGDMADTTYIYVDTDVSETVLQTTTSASSAVGANKLLVAVAKNVASGKEATFTTFNGQAAQGVLVGTLGIEDGAVTNVIATLSVRGWSHDLVFSATDYNTVAWASGTITMGDGTAYSIDAGNTGNMSAPTYIYLDIDTSTTVLQTTTTAANSVGDNKILVATANDVSDTDRDAVFVVFGGPGRQGLITANEITANTITASEIAAATITADKFIGIGDMVFNDADGLLLLGPGCEFTITSWTSLRGQAATISGAFHQEAGRWPGTRALVVEGGVTNLCLNPSAETNSTYWGDYSGGVISRSTSYSVFGSYSISCTTPGSDGTEGCQYLDPANPTGSTTYTASVYVLAPVGATMQIVFSDGVGSTTEAFTGTGKWQRLIITRTMAASPTRYWVIVRTNGIQAITFYVDGLQIEQSAYSTSYCDGSLGEGYSWSGTAHASSSTRTATEVNLDDHIDLINSNNTLTISLWVQMPYDYDDFNRSGGIGTIFYSAGGGSNALAIRYNTSTYKFQLLAGASGNVSLLSSAQSFSAGDRIHLVATCDFSSDEYNLYINGALDGTDTTSESAPTLTGWELGSVSGATQYGWIFDECAVFDNILTASEIAAIYHRNGPIVDASSIDKPGLYILDGRVSIASGTDGVRLDLTNTRMYIGDGPTYNSGVGVWLGVDGGVAKFFVGDSTGNKLLWDGSTLSVTGDGGGITNIDGGEIQTGTIVADAIAANTITASEIAAGTITADEIAANTITASEIAANTITASEIAANTITASEIAANTITASEIAASTITATEMNVSTLSAITADMGTLTAGEIRVGTGTPGSNFTGFRIISTYIAGYNNDTIQCGIRASDGVFVAGGGDVVLDEDGITIDAGQLAPNKIQWYDGSDLLGEVWAWDNDPNSGEIWVAARNKDTTCMAIAVLLGSSDIYDDAYVQAISGYNAITYARIYLYASYVEVVDDALFRVGTGTSDPTDGLEDGCLFYRTDTDKFRGRANGAWVDLN